MAAELRHQLAVRGRRRARRRCPTGRRASVRPPRPTSTSPSRAGTHEGDRGMLRHRRLAARSCTRRPWRESASAKMKPPWQMPWPFTIASVTVIDSARAARRRHPPAACRGPAGAILRPHRLGAGVRASAAGSSHRAPPEHRRALLQERPHALGIVGAAARRACRSCSRSSCASSVFVARGGEHALHRGQRLGRLRRQMRGQLLRLRQQRRIIHRLPDHPPGLGAVRIHRLAEHRQRAGARLADQPRQEEAGARIRHQADLHECLDELGAARRQHDVAGQRVARPGTGGHAVHRADHRHRHRAQPPHEPMVQRGHRAEIGRPSAPASPPVPSSWPAQKPRPSPVSSSARQRAIRLGLIQRGEQRASAWPRSPRSACRAGSAPASASLVLLDADLVAHAVASAIRTTTRTQDRAAAVRPACR